MEENDDDAAAKHSAVRRTGKITTSSDEDLARAVARGIHELYLDEPDREWMPYGNDDAPAPGDYLCVAVAGCQLEVLKQCFEKARIEEYEIEVEYNRITVDSGVDTGPMPDHTASRVEAIELDLTVSTTEEYRGRAKRCLDVCENSCIISRSVERGIDVPLTKSFVVEE